MNIIGLNAYHGDAAAALVMDGELIAAVEEERFNRIKHWAGFPAESIRWCLERGGSVPRKLIMWVFRLILAQIFGRALVI